MNLPQSLPPGPVLEPNPSVCVDDDGPYPCDCEGYPIPGIIWAPDHPAIPGEEGVPIQAVAACVECERYTTIDGKPDDEAAARVVAARYGLEAVFLEDRPWDIDPEDRGNGYGFYGVRNPAIPPAPCMHAIDPHTATTAAADDAGLVVAVSCTLCGTAGVIRVGPGDVAWHSAGG